MTNLNALFNLDGVDDLWDLDEMSRLDDWCVLGAMDGIGDVSYARGLIVLVVECS